MSILAAKGSQLFARHCQNMQNNPGLLNNYTKTRYKAGLIHSRTHVHRSESNTAFLATFDESLAGSRLYKVIVFRHIV